MLTRSQTEYAIQCTIINNDVPEEMEQAVLRVVAASNDELDYILEPSGFIININDDDGIVFFFTVYIYTIEQYLRMIINSNKHVLK